MSTVVDMFEWPQARRDDVDRDPRRQQQAARVWDYMRESAWDAGATTLLAPGASTQVSLYYD